MKNTEKQLLDNAVKSIVNYETAPMWFHSLEDKAKEAEEWMEKQSKSDQFYIRTMVEKEIKAYHTPIEGMNGATADDLNRAFC